MSGILLISLILISFSYQSVEVDGDILQLNNDNFQELVDKYEFLLVYFYNSQLQCKECHYVEKVLTSAAKKLKYPESPFDTLTLNQPVYIGKLEVTNNSRIVSKYDIWGPYPRLVLYKLGIKFEFNQEEVLHITDEKLITWISIRRGPRIKYYKTFQEIQNQFFENQMEKDIIQIIFFLVNDKDQSVSSIEEEAQQTIFETTAILLEEIDNRFIFGYCQDRKYGQKLVQDQLIRENQNQIEKENKITMKNKQNNPIIVMYKQNLEFNYPIYYQSLEDDKLADWIIVNSIIILTNGQNLIEFDEKYLHYVFGVRTPSIICMYKPNYIYLKEQFQQLALQYKFKFIFVIVDLSKESTEIQQLLKYFQFNENQLPQLVIIEPTLSGIVYKYRYNQMYWIENETNEIKLNYEEQYWNYKSEGIQEGIIHIEISAFQKFIQEFFNRNLFPYFQNQYINQEKQEIIINSILQKNIVDKFKIIDINSYIFRNYLYPHIKNGYQGQDYFINFYSRFCDHCKILNQTLKDFISYQGTISNFFILQIDMGENELGIEDFDIVGFPTLYLWTDNTRYDKPLEFKAIRTPKEIQLFLQENSKVFQQYIKMIELQNQQEQVEINNEQKDEQIDELYQENMNEF